MRQRLTYANVMASIAVFIALGGSSYAAVQIQRNAIRAEHIAASAVGAAEIRDRSVGRQELAPGLLVIPQPMKRTNLVVRPEGAYVGATGTPVKSHIIGRFTKLQGYSVVTVLWNGTITTEGARAHHCKWTIRVDGVAGVGGDAVLHAESSDPVSSVVSTRGVFYGLPAGEHTVELWLQGNAPSCSANSQGFLESFQVEETTR